MQNWAKRRDDDYRRILGSGYKYTLRSIFMPEPGWVLVDVDFVGAELAVLAWAAQDANMIDHVRRNGLPEDHPDHYDIHSRQAVMAFNLPGVVPTKTGMKNSGRPGLRVAAKNVNFGVPYGRKAPAIARQCKEEGVDVTDEQAQELIDAYFATYSNVGAFLEECQHRVDVGWMVSCFGRYRRFSKAPDDKVRKEQQREAQNFPIQAGVADAMNTAVYNLTQYRARNPEVMFRMLLQVHDALLIEVRLDWLEHLCDHVLPKCMSEWVNIWPRYLNGRTMTHLTQPYHLDIDKDVCLHWGDTLYEDQAEAYGIPLRFAHKRKVDTPERRQLLFGSAT